MKRFKKNISLGVKQGVAWGLEDVSQSIRNKVGEKFVKGVVEREVAKEFSKGLSIGVPKALFDKLYKSYTNLNTKLAAKGESAGGHNQHLHEPLSVISFDPNSNQHVSERAARQDDEQTPGSDDDGTRDLRGEPPADSEASPEFAEEHNEGSFDRCCVCNTLASEEELLTTTCCSKMVGSLCFEEALQETGKCCLCHETQSLSEPAKPSVYSEHDPDYIFHFVEVQDQLENTRKDKSVEPIADLSESGDAGPCRKKSRLSLTPEDFAEPVRYPSENNVWTARTSGAFKPRDNPVQGKGPPSDPSTKPSLKSHESSTQGKAQRLDSLDSGPEDSVITKENVLRLFDQAVIKYLRDLSREELLITVHEALEELLPSTIDKTIFFGVLFLESGDVQIMHGINQGQAPDLKGDAASWAEVLEKFVRARLGTYTVVMHKVEIETMQLSDEFQRTKAIEELVGYNASAMQSLTRPDDIRLIRWTMKEKNLHKANIGSVTIGLATAAQANEVIGRGLFWKGERRYCVKQGPYQKLVQCDGCQEFGHTAEDCSSPPRCQACAGDHQTTDCPLDLTANLKSLKCVLCGGRHHARDYFCTVKRGEEERLRLENRFYPTDVESVRAAGETADMKSSPPPATSKTPLLATHCSQLSNNDLYPKIGVGIPVVEQISSFAAFDTQIVLQQPDGSKYVIPARRIESCITAPSSSMN